ncbi:MAG: hypothetical protein QOH24_224 [Verrucomicrobiota bacterium]
MLRIQSLLALAMSAKGSFTGELARRESVRGVRLRRSLRHAPRGEGATRPRSGRSYPFGGKIPCKVRRGSEPPINRKIPRQIFFRDIKRGGAGSAGIRSRRTRRRETPVLLRICQGRVRF